MSSDADRPANAPPRGSEKPARAARKPPLTIDLEASPAKPQDAKPQAANPQASKGAEPPGVNRDAPRSANAGRPEKNAQFDFSSRLGELKRRAERARAEVSSEVVRMGLVSLGGALLALLLVALLQEIGVLPVGNDPNAAASTSLVASIKQDVNALAAGLARDQAGAAGLVDRLGKIETALASLERRLGAAETQAKILEGAPVSDPALSGRVNELSARMNALDSASRQLAELSSRIDKLGARPQGEAIGQARIAALASLRDAAGRGAPFSGELKVMRSLGADAALLDPLAGAAEKGVPTRAALTIEFSKVSDAILAATQTPAAGNWLDRLADNARSLVSIRPSGPIEGPGPVAVLSRMRAAVEASQWPRALEERKSLPAAALAASSQWAASVQARIDLDRMSEALASSEAAARPAP